MESKRKKKISPQKLQLKSKGSYSDRGCNQHPFFINFLLSMRRNERMEKPCYQKVLLKLSGEALMGDQEFGISSEVINSYAMQIKEIVDLGVQVSRSEEHTSELQSRQYLVCRLLLEKKK